MAIHTDIAMNADAWVDSDKLQTICEAVVARVFSHLEMADVSSELSVLLTDDAQIKQINKEWRNQDKPTNVLSFPAMDIAVGTMPGPLLGDIIIAYETVEREARLENKTFNDHLTHLFIHGLLHLLGYDHENDTDAELMEKLETEILSDMGIRDPYAIEAIGS